MTAARRSRPKGKESNVERARRRRGRPRRPWYLLPLCCLLGLCLLGFSLYQLWRSDFIQMRYVYLWKYQDEILLYSQRNKVDPFLVAAIIKNESGFNPQAVSKAGAVGLMQLMPDTAAWAARQMGLTSYREGELYNSQTNIRLGCWYLGELEAEFQGNLVLLLVAYNAGRGQTKAWMEANHWTYDFNRPASIPYGDTREYVERVLQDRERYYLYYKDRVRLPPPAPSGKGAQGGGGS